MSELFNECTKGEFEKILSGFTQAPANPRKRCAIKMKETRKNNTHVKCC